MPDMTIEQLQESIAAASASAVTKALADFQGHSQTAAAAVESPEATQRRAEELNATIVEATKPLHEKLAAQESRVLELERDLAETRRVRAETPGGLAELLHTKGWNTGEKHWKRPADPADHALSDLYDLGDAIKIIHERGKHSTGRDERPAMMRALLEDRGLAEHPVMLKLLDTYTSGSVSQFVPSIMSPNFIAQVDREANVRPLFGNIAMNAKTITMPADTGVAKSYLMTGSENSNVTEDSSLQSRTVITFTAEDVAVYKGYSDQIEQDSIVAILPWVQRGLAYSVAYWLDRAILDGDTTATHMDSSVAAGDTRKAWQGLRKYSLANSHTKDLSTFTAEALTDMPSLMGRYASTLNRLAWIVPSCVHWEQLVNLKDANDNPVWLPANTPGAPNPVVTGQVGQLYGIPVVISGLIRTDLYSTGVYDTSYTNNKTCLHLVNREAWLVGTLKEITMESDKDIVAGTYKVVLRWRGDFQHLYGTDCTTVLGYNITRTADTGPGT